MIRGALLIVRCGYALNIKAMMEMAAAQAMTERGLGLSMMAATVTALAYKASPRVPSLPCLVQFATCTPVTWVALTCTVHLLALCPPSQQSQMWVIKTLVGALPHVLMGTDPLQRCLRGVLQPAPAQTSGTRASGDASAASGLSDGSSDEETPSYCLSEDVSDSEVDVAEGEDADVPSTPASGVPPEGFRYIPHCTTMFRSVEDLYGLLLLRGPGCLREDQCETVREGFNISSFVALPSLYFVRKLTERARAWMLPMQSFPMAAAGLTEKVPVACSLPSAHIRRDVAFAATFQNFVAAEQRPEKERDL